MLADLAEQRCHLTAGQAGRLAAKAEVKLLMLTHISARYHETDELLAQARAEFENCLVATDSMRIEVSHTPTLPVAQTTESEAK